MMYLVQAFINGTAVEVFLEGGLTVLALVAAVIVPLTVLALLKRHTNV